MVVLIYCAPPGCYAVKRPSVISCVTRVKTSFILGRVIDGDELEQRNRRRTSVSIQYPSPFVSSLPKGVCPTPLCLLPLPFGPAPGFPLATQAISAWGLCAGKVK